MFKLKIIILPLSMLIALMVSYTMIWPEYLAIKIKSEELTRLQADRDKAENKRINASALSEDLANSVREESLVLSMLPESKQEEKLLGGIYHIASDAGATLVNITWTDVPILSNGLLGLKSTGNVNDAKKGEYSALQVTAMFGGKYNNIRSLITQFNELARLKYISEISIQRAAGVSERKTEIGDGGEAISSTNSDQGNNDLPNEELLFRIKAYFGYAPKSMMLSSAPLEIFQSNEINFSSIEMFSSYIPLEDVYVGEVGKSNLFSPGN